MVKIYHNPNFQSDSESGNLSSWEKCVHVADVETDSLDEALEAVRNEGELNFKSHLVLVKKQSDRPTQEGDILVHNNQKYLLETYGFLALQELNLGERKQKKMEEMKKKSRQPGMEL